MRSLLGVLFGVVGLAGAAEPVCEIWDVPESGIVRLSVPKSAHGDGLLAVRIDGQPVTCQEVRGADLCVVRLSPELVAKARGAALRVEMAREGGASCPGRPAPALVVSNAACAVHFDAGKMGGLPHRIDWADGKSCDRVSWYDRVYAAGNDQGLAGVWMLRNAPKGEVLDCGTGPLFRHVRTSGEFAMDRGRTCDARPRATYDWIFPNDAPGWVMVRMSFAEANPGTWDELQAGILEFPFGTFAQSVVGGGKSVDLQDIPSTGSSVRRTSRSWSAVVDGRDFAAVYSGETACFVDTNRKIVYLHASNGSSYGAPWSGSPVTRTAFFRFGAADRPAQALDAEPPLRAPGGLRRLDLFAAVDKVRPGEDVTTVREGALELRVGVLGGARAEIRSVRVDGALVAFGPQRLFTLGVENVQTGARTELSSSDAWTSVQTASDGRSWTFAGPKAHPELADLRVTVACGAGRPDDVSDASRVGLDWTFFGTSGSDAYAFAEATVGALEFCSSGAGMRALYPGCMGNVEANPCSDAVRRRGSYPSMHCAMPWEAVWDETAGTGFYVGAHDPRGGAKYVALTGDSGRSGVRLAVTHRLAWDGRCPGAESTMSGAIAWRPLKGDWYDAALVYRDWAREHAAWYPKMGPEGRVSTPKWFKELGYIVRTYGLASNAVADVKTCQDFLDVPVMAHWYHWHQIPFDNDYPHYFPAKPGFEEGVRAIQALGAHAVPYTNGHIWDMHDRGIEDWLFSSIGAKGACLKRDGSFYTERYRSVETNGERVVFAPMCPASQVWHDKVGENCDKVVNGAGLDGYYMDQVGAFSTIDCRNPAHGHPFGGGSWWQEGYRRLLADARARCTKPVFFATEGNGEHTFDQIDAFVCWNVEGGMDTVPAFEICYSGAVNVYCRSYVQGAKGVRQMRMKLANTLADGELIGWMPAAFCREPGLKDYLRVCTRFRHHLAPWFYKGEMRRPPRLLDSVPVWDETWDIFGRKRPTRMPVVQTGARRTLDYAYDAAGNRIWKTGRVVGAFIYFTNFSNSETVTSRLAVDWADLGVDPARAMLTRVDEEGRQTPLSAADLEKPFTFAPGTCWGIEVHPW